MHTLARSGRTKREMNFGKREMAVRVDVQVQSHRRGRQEAPGKKKERLVRQFPDVITGPCPGRTEPAILLYSAANITERLQRGCHTGFAPFGFFTRAPPPARRRRYILLNPAGIVAGNRRGRWWWCTIWRTDTARAYICLLGSYPLSGAIRAFARDASHFF